MWKLSCVIILMLLLRGSAYAQFVLENAPASLRWFQIETPHFNILFPQQFNHEALRMANTLDHLYGPVSKSLQAEPKKINILLQNRNAISNGFVALAPLRSEFFTMPPQTYNFIGTNDWLNLLAVHEFRHVVQNEKAKTGFNKFVYWILGEYAFSGMGFASMPIWFKEGDAVSIETALTSSGRGRIPAFNMALRASFLEKGPFRFNKQYLGSYKDFIPDHYVFGYFMTDYLRNQYETNPWEEIVQQASQKSIFPFTFSNAMKKSHGKYLVPTYNEMAEDVTTKWRTQLNQITPSDFDPVLKERTSVFTNYLYPQPLEDGQVVALKTGIGDIQTFVLLDTIGTEAKLLRTGILNDPGFLSRGSSHLVWCEYTYDPRWAKRTYSVVKMIDLQTKKVRILTKKSRFSGPAISPNDEKIAVVDNLFDGRTQVKIIDVATGAVLQEIGKPTHNFISMLRWAPDGKTLVALRTKNSKKAIVRLNPGLNTESIVRDYTAENIGHPVSFGPYVFYNSPYSGIDNIYALDTRDGSEYQVTSSRYGAFNPSFRNGTMYYNDFTVEGMDVVKVPVDPIHWKEIERVEQDPIGYFPKVVEQEGNPDVLESVPVKAYPIEPYRKGRRLLNIHSWGPYIASSPLNWDIGVFFQDVLSLNQGFAGYQYNVDENTGKWAVNYTYAGFYPAFDITGYTGNGKASQQLGDTVNVNYDWKEKGMTAGIRFPWNLTRSKYLVTVELGNSFGYNRVSGFTNAVNDDRYSVAVQGNGNLLSNTFSFTATHLLKRSKRDIQSRWGQVLSLKTVNTPFGGDYFGGIGSITAYLYFPGIGKHHSLNFLGALQGRNITLNPDNFLFSNQVPFPRGYSSASWQRFYTLRTNYDLTLWNADLGLGPVLNIQRIRTKLFYDTGYGETMVSSSDANLQVNSSFNYHSMGAELWFDFNVMRLLPLLSGGLRAVYVDGEGLKFEIVLGNIQI